MGVVELVIASLIITAVTTGVSVYTSMEAAKRQNEALARAARSNEEIQREKVRQIAKRRDLTIQQTLEYQDIESLKLSKQRAIAKGKIRVGMAEGGLSTGGSGAGADIMNYADVEANFSHDILAMNTESTIQKIELDAEGQNLQNVATYEAQINAAMMQARSPFLSALSGGMSGLGTGISMGAGVAAIASA